MDYAGRKSTLIAVVPEAVSFCGVDLGVYQECQAVGVCNDNNDKQAKRKTKHISKNIVFIQIVEKSIRRRKDSELTEV